MILAWTNNEIELLINKYENSSSNEIEKLFPNKSYKSITMKAHRLGLRKTKEVISNHIAKRNKMVGRDLSFEYLKKIALKYKTRGEFQFKDNSAYTVSRINGWLESICDHMIPQKYSTPQLILNLIMQNLLKTETSYNDRKTIKPLELDVYIPKFKIAFEYDGKHWHKNKSNDVKIKKCSDLGIKLFVLIENNRRYEEDIKSQLIEMLIEINKWCNSKISITDIMKTAIDYEKIIMDKHDVVKLCSKYDSLELFKNENETLYQRLIRLKLLEQFTSHMERKHNKPWNDESAKLIISKYEYLYELIKNHHGVYLYCRRNNTSLLKDLKYKNR